MKLKEMALEDLRSFCASRHLYTVGIIEQRDTLDKELKAMTAKCDHHRRQEEELNVMVKTKSEQIAKVEEELGEMLASKDQL